MYANTAPQQILLVDFLSLESLVYLAIIKLDEIYICNDLVSQTFQLLPEKPSLSAGCIHSILSYDMLWTRAMKRTENMPQRT